MSFGELAIQASGLAKRLSSEFAEYAAPVSEAEDSKDLPLPPGDAWLVEYDHRITDEELRTATRKLFVDEYYSHAVHDGVKALNECIRARTGSTLDGDSLMTETFSVNSPKLRIPEKLNSKNAESEQRGHMMLCQGVVAAWRNPRAHKVVDDEPDETILMLELVQRLMQVTRAATKTKPKKKAAGK